jgi:hypothetical protein
MVYNTSEIYDYIKEILYVFTDLNWKWYQNEAFHYKR